MKGKTTMVVRILQVLLMRCICQILSKVGRCLRCIEKNVSSIYRSNNGYMLMSVLLGKVTIHDFTTSHEIEVKSKLQDLHANLELPETLLTMARKTCHIWRQSSQRLTCLGKFRGREEKERRHPVSYNEGSEEV